MSDTIVALLGLVFLFLVYGLLTAGRKHRGCTRCLDDEDAPRCDSCPLSRLDALKGDVAKRSRGSEPEGPPPGAHAPELRSVVTSIRERE